MPRVAAAALFVGGGSLLPVLHLATHEDDHVHDASGAWHAHGRQREAPQGHGQGHGPGYEHEHEHGHGDEHEHEHEHHPDPDRDPDHGSHHGDGSLAHFGLAWSAAGLGPLVVLAEHVELVAARAPRAPSTRDRLALPKPRGPPGA